MASERVQRQIDRLLDEADEAALRLDWTVVRDRAQAALAYDPENADARTYLATAGRGLRTSPAAVPPARAESIAAVRSAEAVPESFASGRYIVEKYLGEGGKKKVYLAHDSTLDRDVAFALIKTEGLDATGRDRIKREAQSMGRLGAHPHIVTVFDLGEEQGQPYMVTELMGGGDVEGCIAKAADHKLPMAQVLSIAEQVCAGLEFAHSKGIVHRDLKPGNVWLTAPLGGAEAVGSRQWAVDPATAAPTAYLPASGASALPTASSVTAKIGDFGLAVAIDQTRLTQAGMMVGTVSYMPPEQAMGGEVTARSDLYSLGAMLYELVTGRPPFLGDDHVAVIGQHLNTPPVAPSWHRPDCPRPLEALILRLLAKDPRERPPSAADVRQALAAIDLSASKEGAEAVLDDSNALDSLAGGVFVGRQREMGELKAALEDALSGRGRLVMLVGEPGIGKTRTVQELSTYAALRQCQVLWGRCYDSTGVPPYWPWVQAVRSYVHEAEPERLRSEMGSGAADIAAIASEVRERLPDLNPLPALEPEQARFRLFDSITSFLKAAGRHQPLVLVLEDLHWADRPSLLLLEFLARELAGARLLIACTYRDVDITRQHPLSLTLGELTRERLFQRVLLRGLGRDDVAKFIELTAGLTPPAALVDAVHTHTEGNPLFLTEVVRLLVQESALSTPLPPVGADGAAGAPQEYEGGGRARAAGSAAPAGPDWQSWTVRIPEGVREVIGRRLSRLSERCNQVLTVAAVIGREFSLEQVGALVDDLPKERLLDVVEEALAARIIEELPRAVGRYQFTHALVQETLAEELTTTRRVRLHARIAEALERLYGAEAGTHAAELAQHFAEAQTVLGTDRFVHYCLVAGERALNSYAWEEAQAHFGRALAARDGRQMDAEAAALLFGSGRAQAALGKSEEAQASLSRAFDYYVETGEPARAAGVAEHSVPHLPGQLAGEPAFLARALKLVPPDSLSAGRLQSLYGEVLGVDEGDYEGAQHAFGQALATAQRFRDETLEMQTLARSGRVNGYHLRLRECLDQCIRAIGLARRLGDPIREANSYYFAALALWSAGNAEGARLHTEAGLVPAQRLRDRFLLANLLWAGETIGRLTGDFRSARVYSDRGLGLMPRDPRLLGTRTLLEYELGDLEQGGAYYDRLLATKDDAVSSASFEYAFVASVTGFAAHYTGLVARFNFTVAKAAAKAVLESDLVTPLVAIRAQTGLALIAVEENDADGAAKGYQFHLSLRGTMTPGGMGSVDHLLGLLAWTMGRAEQALEHFEEALAFCREAGYRPEYAHAACDYAGVLLQRDRSAGLTDAALRLRAVGLLDDALAIARPLGMRPLMERALRHKDLLTA